jgi:hypothetical protein
MPCHGHSSSRSASRCKRAFGTTKAAQAVAALRSNRLTPRAAEIGPPSVALAEAVWLVALLAKATSLGGAILLPLDLCQRDEMA